jgi:intein-encoded DNA endonuclease-like protein
LQFQPSWELSFIIGSFLGDGSFVEDSDYHHQVKLAVRDRDFAEAFNLAVGHILGRKTNKLTITHDLGKVYYESKYSSRPLGLFLNSNLGDLRCYAEFFPAAFLRGLFSADGCAGVSIDRNCLRLQIVLGNSDLKLLELAESILRVHFDIHSNTYLGRKKGTTWKNGHKLVVLRKDAYTLRIERIRDVKLFVDKVGFVIHRKQQLAEQVLLLTTTLGSSRAGVAWRNHHSRKKGSRYDNFGPIE